MATINHPACEHNTAKPSGGRCLICQMKDVACPWIENRGPTQDHRKEYYYKEKMLFSPDNTCGICVGVACDDDQLVLRIFDPMNDPEQSESEDEEFELMVEC